MDHTRSVKYPHRVESAGSCGLLAFRAYAEAIYEATDELREVLCLCLLFYELL